jgi:transposase
MTGRRKRYSAEFKAKVALEAIRGEMTVAQLAARHGVHQTMINVWRRQAVEGMAGVFSGKSEAAEAAREARSTNSTPRSPNCSWNAISCDGPPLDEHRADAGDDRAAPSVAAGRPAVRPRRHRPVDLLWWATGRETEEPGADEGDRRAVHGDTVVRVTADGAASSPSVMDALQIRARGWQKRTLRVPYALWATVASGATKERREMRLQPNARLCKKLNRVFAFSCVGR